jgi:hypothetical protein
MQRTRDCYATIGYRTLYRWAHYVNVPFHPLEKPLRKARVTIITTAAPYQPGMGEQGPGTPCNAAAKFCRVYSGETIKAHDLRIAHVGYDRVNTSAEDSGTWFPLPQLLRLHDEESIGAVTLRFHGAPTNRSHRATIEVDAPRDSLWTVR